MTKRDGRGSPSRLQINRSIVLVNGSKVQTIEPHLITPEVVGLKALGLLKLPKPWVPDFFVVSGRCPPSQKAIERAARLIDLRDASEVWVRSSGTLEGLHERGSLDSMLTPPGSIERTISDLQASSAFQSEQERQTIHFVIQRRVLTKKKGHLSNERRLQRHPRDWTYEVEAEDPHHLGVRKWRDAALKDSSTLGAEAFAHVPHALRAIAAWVGNSRAHLEWVWDGVEVWAVQLDLLVEFGKGVHPKSLVSKGPRPAVSTAELVLFVPSSLDDTTQYSKLNNARLYASLGYGMPVFYVLNNPSEIMLILESGDISSDLESDLRTLCEHPFVIRTDANGLPPDKRQMLPRSDELRSAEAAIDWLRSSFRDVMVGMQGASDIVLIGHHFIPALASAWCQAKPDDRRSRIESLWGIPEGIYCFAHDVFDVDTMSLNIDGKKSSSAKILMQRERFKSKFVAPNGQGEWKVHETAVGPDWTRSIGYDSWVKEIAWTSRRIAIEAGGPVVVMWFVGVDKGQGLNSLLPWYHEPWRPSGSGYKKAAPRTKLNSAQIRSISNKQSWEALMRDMQNGALVERVIIDPKDESIIRSREFVNELAAHAKEHNYVIELSGGLLSHFYYMLSKEGCNVECVDLFGVSEEKIEYNKLVRDNIPDDIRKHGETVQVYELHGDALITSLKRKVVEEAYEVLQAETADDMADELADLAEVMESLVRTLRLSMKDIADRQAIKKAKRGGFEKGLMLAKTSLPAPIRSEIDAEEGAQVKKLSDVIELPQFETDFHVDQRFDRSGVPERQITITLSTFEDDYSSREHVFDMPMASGDMHTMFFKSHVERLGATLKLKVRLTSAAQQLALPLSNDGSGDQSSKDLKD